MRPANVIEIQTPKKFLLNGLWFGPLKPRRMIILAHGLTGSAFSRLPLVEKLVNDTTAVVTFNNRGHSIVSKLRQKVGNETKSALAGTAHEIFTDCVDDVDGVLQFVRKQGVKNIFLAGHSTGCQKITYWAHKKGQGVRGLIYFAPLSDYASVRSKPLLRKAAALAKRMVKLGKGGELLPREIWYEYLDAQRFLSLYTPDSVEEMFSYAQPGKLPKIYRSITLPVLAFYAGADEYADRPAEEIAKWFKAHSRAKRFSAEIVSGVSHGFVGAETHISQMIQKWITSLK